ncbi:MAG: NAD(P)-dependent oxidoreductase [Deltaproteobacteria bacterium]|nr:MAG: NAD(P)-dependent oxidoreductase [Deltaproteobacteria bacterium]
MTNHSKSPLVCVTGGTGFVGQHVCRLLQEKSQPYRCLVRAHHRDSITMDDSVVVGSLEEEGALDECLKGAHAVIHLASKHIDSDQTGFVATNVEGTRALCQAAVRQGVKRVIYLSSAGVYGHGSIREVDEHDPVKPDTALSRSKAEAERILLEYHRQGDFQVVIARPRFLYGPGDQHFLPRLARATTQRTWLPCSGKAVFSLIHVEDLASLLVRLCEVSLPNDDHPVYHLADSSPVLLKELVSALAEKLSCPTPRFVASLFPVLYATLKSLEFLTGTDPETTKRSMTSIRLGFLAHDQWLSTQKLVGLFPDFKFRSFKQELKALSLDVSD